MLFLRTLQSVTAGLTLNCEMFAKLNFAGAVGHSWSARKKQPVRRRRLIKTGADY